VGYNRRVGRDAGTVEGKEERMTPDHGPLIEVSRTPNPNAMKFTLDRVLLATGSRSYSSRFEALDDPLAVAIFEISGVQSLFYMANFVTVTKDPGAAWEGITRSVETAIRDHLNKE
jgi:NFU1 iron-sulfur cluster scaffold homolog, mitochondrial